MSDDPREALSRLRARVAVVLWGHGLVMHQCIIVPSSGDPGATEIHFTAAAADGPKEADEFEAVLRSAHAAEIEAQAAEAEADLRRRLIGGDGFL